MVADLQVNWMEKLTGYPRRWFTAADRRGFVVSWLNQKGPRSGPCATNRTALSSLLDFFVHFQHYTLAAQFAEQVIQCVVELGRGTLDSLLQRSGRVAYGNRLMAFGASFHLATFVMRSGLGAVVVAQMRVRSSS
jgi:hypothetical protein